MSAARDCQHGLLARQCPLCEAACDHAAAMELIGQLKAEVERLRADVKHWRYARASAIEAGDALHAEVERLRVDAERLDYIERNCRKDPDMKGNHTWWPTTFGQALRGPTLRAAIDAKRGES